MCYLCMAVVEGTVNRWTRMLVEKRLVWHESKKRAESMDEAKRIWEQKDATITQSSARQHNTRYHRAATGEWPRVPLWVRKQSGNDIRRQHGSYARVDDVIGYRWARWSDECSCTHIESEHGHTAYRRQETRHEDWQHWWHLSESWTVTVLSLQG